MELKALTKKQARVLNYIISEIEVNNNSPTIREIGSKFKMKSTGSVRDVLKALRKKNYILYAEGKSRGNILNPKIFRVEVKGKNNIMIKKK